MNRYIFFVVTLLICSVANSIEIPKNPDEVDVYIVPMDDFPLGGANQIAKIMSDDMNLWVKSSVRLGNLHSSKLPGTNQLIFEDIISKSNSIFRSFGDVGENTYFLILTTRDINSGAGVLRFLFSGHDKELNVSVISLQRLVNYKDGKAVFDEISKMRLYKMMKRAIGEMHYGWKRTIDKQDIMYAPIMSLKDLDKLGLDHYEEKQKDSSTDSKLLF